MATEGALAGGDAAAPTVAVLTSTVAPALGAIMSNLLFLGPFLEVRTARRSRLLGAINPMLFPWIFINCVGYTSYGFVKRDLYIIIGNVGGVVLGLFYLLSAYRLTPSGAVARRLELLVLVLGSLWILLDSIAVFIPDQDTRESLIAYPALIMCICMFAAPLSTIRNVVRQRDTSSINRGFLTMQIINCSMWTVYGLVTGDEAIVTGNSLGLTLGLCQAALVLTLPRKQNLPQLGMPHVSAAHAKADDHALTPAADGPRHYMPPMTGDLAAPVPGVTTSFGVDSGMISSTVPAPLQTLGAVGLGLAPVEPAPVPAEAASFVPLAASPADVASSPLPNSPVGTATGVGQETQTMPPRFATVPAPLDTSDAAGDLELQPIDAGQPRQRRSSHQQQQHRQRGESFERERSDSQQGRFSPRVSPMNPPPDAYFHEPSSAPSRGGAFSYDSPRAMTAGQAGSQDLAAGRVYILTPEQQQQRQMMTQTVTFGGLPAEVIPENQPVVQPGPLPPAPPSTALPPQLDPPMHDQHAFSPRLRAASPRVRPASRSIGHVQDLPALGVSALGPGSNATAQDRTPSRSLNRMTTN